MAQVMSDKRKTIYLVKRQDDTICAAYAMIEEAEAAAGVYEQEWFDKVGNRVHFDVIATTYYG